MMLKLILLLLTGRPLKGALPMEGTTLTLSGLSRVALEPRLLDVLS
jgi:hypothetical protein